MFLFDRWWNPAVEDQAINRAHRIGAERPVTVTRFLAVDTIEQRINEILERKRELFDTVFGQTIAAPTSGLSREEIFSLFNRAVYGVAVDAITQSFDAAETTAARADMSSASARAKRPDRPKVTRRKVAR